MPFCSETGSELLSRLKTSENISKAPKIFGDFTTGRVIEVSGESGSGKTELLYSWIIHVILPKSWGNIVLDGENGSAIFIDTNFQFNALKLIIEIETKILENCNAANAQRPSKSELRNFVKSCLSKIHVLQCSSTEELLVTLLSFNELLSNLPTPRPSVLAIDSITSFYWCDRMLTGDNIRSMEEQNCSVVMALTKIVEENDIVLISTRQLLLKAERTPNTRDYDFLGKKWQKLVSCQMWLQKESVEAGRTNIKIHVLNQTRQQVIYVFVNDSGVSLKT